MGRIARLLSIFLAFQLMGGHWIALQSVAWTKMTLAFSEEVSLPEAVFKALSGQAPCKVCRMVREGQRQESEKEATAFAFKTEAVVADAVEIVPRLEQVPDAPYGERTERRWTERAYPPLTPPPNS